MRETGFEPVSPETAVLKTAGITELTDSRKTKIFTFLLLLSYSSENNKSYIYIILQLLILKNDKNKRMSCVKNNSSVMPVGLSHLNV